jgi:hypothetical protein
MTLKSDCVLNISNPQIQIAPYVAPNIYIPPHLKNRKPNAGNAWEKGPKKISHKVEIHKKVSQATQDHHSDALNMDILEVKETPEGIVEQKIHVSGLNINIVKKMNPPTDVEQATQKLKGLLNVTSPSAPDHISSQIFSSLEQSEPELPYSNVNAALPPANELFQLVGGRKKYKGRK